MSKLRAAQHRHNRAVAVMHFAQARIAKASRESLASAHELAQAEAELESSEKELQSAQREELQ